MTDLAISARGLARSFGAVQAELDALLDKISATGLESLTTDEKRRLNDLSKRLR